MAPGPLFVVGLWRSGTSLLYALLNQHPQISILYEGDLPTMGALFPFGRAKRDWLARWNFWNNAPGRHRLEEGDLPRSLGLRAATETVCRQYAARKGATIWGCKSPAYHNQLPFLARTFPNARFIVIWRDLADICRSIVRAGESSSYFSQSGILRRAILGYEQLKRGCDALLRSGAPLHQLHYEEMVRFPQAEMTAICDFLQIPFDSRMLSLEGADISAVYPDEHHALLRTGTIMPSGPTAEILSPATKAKIDRYVGKWKKETQQFWPRYPLMAPACRPHLSAGEALLDRCFYRILRSYDRAKLWLYAFLPLPLLRRYRQVRHRP
ncbi:MAG TPA: sulfotransferase [Terriglobales bacterium]|nr:sulfotransferase [Terriglobales bacterium]